MSNQVPTALEQFYQLLIQSNGTGPVPYPLPIVGAYPKHPILNFIGGSVVENVAANRLDVTIGGGGGPPTGAAGGDLDGTYPNPGVARLQGTPVSVTAPTAGQVLTDVGGIWTPAASSASTLWQLAIDLDLSAQANATYATDGNYTLAGMTWTKYRSVNDAVAPALVNGSGLIVQPAASTFAAGTLSYPQLYLPFTQIPALVGIAPDWPLRISVHISTINDTASDQLGIVAATSILTGTYFVVSKAFGNAFELVASTTASASVASYVSAGAHATRDVVALYLPGGLAGSSCAEFAGAYSAGWPTNASLLPCATTFLGTDAALGDAGTMASWGVSLGAKRSTNALSVTFAHLRVEYLPR